jgi:OOP family OmpA-OmpF porin
MKKIMLIPMLLLGAIGVASEYKYEVSPMVGYNFAEGALKIKDDGYPMVGLEVQMNTPDSKISPEFSLLYSSGVDYVGGGDTDILRGAFNGVYTFDALDSVIPFAKMGIGIENIKDENFYNQSGFFVDAGAGAKVAFTDHIALKLEAIYMGKIERVNSRFLDNNFAALAGLTFAFGAQEQKIIDGDDDNDGILNSVDQCPNTQAGQKVDAQGCKVDGDDDNDGVLNSVDTCPYTPAGEKVDAKGCKVDGDDDHDGVLNSVDACPYTQTGEKVGADGCLVDKDHDGVLNAMDECPNTPIGTMVDEKGCKVDGDDDHDGVVNSKDICPNSAVGDAVNSDGCAKTIILNVQFGNNSDAVSDDSIPNIDAYAIFLKTHTNYNAKIVGYTDSKGSASYNQALSQRRADQIKYMLLERGVSSNQVTSVGMGEENPIADNATSEGRAQNRRIESELTKN